MYDIRNFSIISTENDSMLYFSSSYQRAVTQAINNLMKELEKNPGVDIASVHLSLICNSRTIEIIDDSAKIHLIGDLAEYDKTEDLATFTF